MGVINNLDTSREKTVDYFIDSKVDDLIEKAVTEGQKRQQLQNKVADECSDINTDEGLEYLTSIADFSDFPKYSGRGIQDAAPDIDANTLTMWFSEVENNEVEDFIAKVSNAGFEKQGQDFVKEVDGKKLIMSISSSGDRLRLFYKRG
ncbi:MAG: hypothetical protein KBS43_00280 [Oscillospiraceae bacterium]|nr:hypothetical protein [Candidatus Limimonas coprohippi]